MSFNQDRPTVPTVLNTSNCFVFGNTATGNALSVQQLGAGNVATFRTTTGATALFVGASGNVGVGTTNPGGTFNVLSGNAGFPDTSGSGTSNVAARIQSGSICLDFGSIGGTNPFWIQNHLNTAWNTTYPLLLNPNGGYVGIGTTNPGYALDVLGSARVNVGTSNVLIGAGQGAGQGGLFMIPQSSIAGSSWNLGCGLQGSYANAITFTSGTNVGIGTTNPTYALDVGGAYSTFAQYAGIRAQCYVSSTYGTATINNGANGTYSPNTLGNFGGIFYFTVNASDNGYYFSSGIGYTWNPALQSVNVLLTQGGVAVDVAAEVLRITNNTGAARSFIISILNIRA